jgi:hypothetical protein
MRIFFVRQLVGKSIEYNNPLYQHMFCRPNRGMYIISLRLEVSLFVLSPEIKDRDEVEVTTGQSRKRPLI